MESESPLVPFPLLLTPIETNYRACTIPYRFASDNPRKATPTEIEWIDLFLKSVPSFKQRAENDNTVVNAPEKAEKFAKRYTEILEEMKKNPESHGGPPNCILLCRLREQILRELGFMDIFKKVKEEENAKAITLFEGVCRLNDGIEDEGQRVENLIRGILAGNIFDLGSAQVVLTANDLPSINDVTYTELVEIVRKLKDENEQIVGVDTSNLFIVNSGNDLPVIDLSCVSPELAYIANDADLVILEGMGRGIETNLYAQLKCDSIKIGMVKHPEVARFLGGRLYDCVFKYNEVLNYD